MVTSRSVLFLAAAAALGSCAKEPPTLMTQGEYDQISVGMPWENMAKVVKHDPNGMTSMSVAGMPTQQTFTWRNPDGTVALITNSNGSVISKSQLGALPEK